MSGRPARLAQCLILGVLVVVSGLNWLYLSRGVAQSDYVKVWDAFHYLLGPKYYAELGYFDFYNCAVVADDGTTRLIGGRDIRDLRTYQLIGADEARGRARCHERFTSERWQEFARDYRVMAETSGPMMREMLRDHGYDGTPLHAWISGLIANSFELDYRSMTLATLLDTVGIAVMMIAITRAFGWTIGALFAVFFFTAFTDRFYYIGGSFFRYYWMIFSGLGLAALRRNRYGLAGCCLATAAMLNVFPVLFLAGIGLRALWQIVRQRTLSGSHLRFIVASVATALVLGAISISHADGFGNWTSFLEKMAGHTELITRSRIGLDLAFLYRGELTPQQYLPELKAAELQDIGAVTKVIAALLMIALVLLVPHLSDLEATIFVGFGSFFCLFTTVEYYYGIFAFWVLLWSERWRDDAALRLVALPFLFTALVYWVWDRTGFLALANNTLMSWSVLACLAAAIVYFAWQGDRRPRLGTLLRDPVRVVTGSIVTIAVVSVPAVTLARWSSLERAPGPMLAFGGDVNLGRHQNAISAADGPAAALGRVDALARADLAVVNLESVVASRGERAVEKGERASYYYRGRPEMLGVLGAAGVDVVATANNHSLDYGVEALREQSGYLRRMGIGEVGAGENRAAACAAVFRRAGDLTVAIFAVDATQRSFGATEGEPGTCYLPLDRPVAWREHFEGRIGTARREAHLVLVAVHWGANFREAPSPSKIAAGHAIIDAGADAVLGSSAHVLQGVETYRGRPIIHDAGNLLFDLTGDPRDSAVFSLVLDPRGVRQLWIEPVRSYHGYSLPARGEAAEAVLRTLQERSRRLGTLLFVRGDEAAIDFPDLPDRQQQPEPGAAPGVSAGAAPEPLAAVPDECRAIEVPLDAALTSPIPMGPLTLLGARPATRHVFGRRSVWIETYWRAERAVDQDLLLSVRGDLVLPVRGDLMKVGSQWRSEHEPCDWLWPTSRWRPGEIYRDFGGARPPNEIPSGEGQIIFGVGLREPKGHQEKMEPLFVLPFTGDQ